MRAAFVRSPFEFEIRDVEAPEPGFEEVLLDVAMVGICGTDVHLAAEWAGEWRRFGHETAAHVTAVGTGVTDLAIGDLVTVRTTTMCGRCRFCMDGRPRGCLNWRESRLSSALADQMVAPRRSVWRVDDLDPLATTLIEPLSVALSVVDTAEIALDHDVAVVGPGPIGIMAIKVAKLRGARRVFVVGTHADIGRFDLCEEMGADLCLVAETEDVVGRIRAETGGVGLDRVVVTAPPVAIPPALALGRYGAIVTFVGFAADDEAGVVPIDLNAFHNAKLQLRASYAAPLAPFAQANRLLAAGQIPVDKVITHRFPLDEVATAIQVVAKHEDGVVKAVMAIR